jgi:hypothetical protein
MELDAQYRAAQRAYDAMEDNCVLTGENTLEEHRECPECGGDVYGDIHDGINRQWCMICEWETDDDTWSSK